jgi:hypothetical protein
MYLRPILNNYNFKKINKLYCNSIIEHRILTHNGFFTNINNKIKNYIINRNNINNEILIIEDTKFILQENIFSINNNDITYIPYPNKVISIEIKEYKISNFDTSLFIEYLNDDIINDFYFIIKNNQHFEKDFNNYITKFISYLK